MKKKVKSPAKTGGRKEKLSKYTDTYIKGKAKEHENKGNSINSVEFSIFKYKHNPSDNPKVLEDAMEDSSAVYGYRPNDTGSIKSFANDDWSSEELVNSYKENRIKYHQKNDINIEIANTMRAEGKTDSEIARVLVERRNSNRLASYIDEDGNITDIDLYNQALEHCKTYEQLKEGTATRKGKTDLEIIESSTRGNPGMDACCGLYDIYYDTYNIEE
ncbi:MAG: hypothetical protein HDT39_15175 [Lachnospiraceae bacterium]|nr:hypothetical protein [Lachnospiraceae bacterium]